jgi:flagella basal body P-ring formation protein FlgA
MLAPVDTTQATGTLAMDIEAKMRQMLPEDQYQYIITIPQLSSSLPNEYDSLSVQLQGNNRPFGSCYVKLYFYQNGTVASTANVGLQVQWFQQVRIAAMTIERGQALRDDMFAVVQQELKTLADQPLDATANLKGLEAARTIRQGTTLSKSLVRAEQLVDRGDRVTIVYQNGALLITALGEAREPGGKGDIIKVRNISTRKTIYAEVQDGQSVRIVR